MSKLILHFVLLTRTVQSLRNCSLEKRKMGGASREGRSHSPLTALLFADIRKIGGKVKPLKAPKKEKKEMDDDEIAFKAKQQAGTLLSDIFVSLQS